MKEYLGYIIKINEDLIEVAIPSIKKEICVFYTGVDSDNLRLGFPCTIIEEDGEYHIKRKEDK